ncbi:beta-ketoacyl-ACP synthase [Phormidium sp. FACHB-592]|uniref:Beta-ketoacyl-ACP synthase n=1 Tax=Stenomitos frigidus AS-A4 TaxID=2933935 RepID=A0ABV0KGM4_9CYAN|nr:beta-ketoacyl-ACP synthase [Phormidium sp. FACHB-592]MBD2073691.1 beta-ketoacyl-ACP synthase [Phormidium sp. FACHB-592]
MDVVVTGIGLASALGSLDETWKRLLAGESGIQQQQPFPTFAPCPLALIGNQPTALVELTQRVAAAALKDAGLLPPLNDCAIVVGSSRGNQAEWERLIRARWEQETARVTDASYPSFNPLNWHETLPHAAAIATAQYVQTTASVQAPMAACATGLWAIAQGFELVRTGRYECVLAGAIETPITPLTLAGFAQMGASARTGAHPFDRRREGLVLAEGGAILVLEAADRATQRNAPIYGHILGAGLTADGYHVSTPEPGGRMAIAAIQQCLQRANLDAATIGYIHAHGTATTLNDRNEAHLIQTLFPEVPVSSTKGATGHTLGASGAIGAAFCLMALKHQLLPPCVGLKQPEFSLNFVMQPQPYFVNAVLCLSFGFGGQNAAIAFAASARDGDSAN